MGGERRRLGWVSDEPFGVGPVGVVEHGGALVAHDLGGAVVDIGGGVQAQPGMAMLLVVPRKKTWQCARAASIEANWPGKSGRYFRVLNWASEYGLSSETCGRLWDWVTPRSASRNATGLEVIEEPRSAWMVSWSRPMPCLATVWRISTWASAADSRPATIQPTT